MNLPLFNALNKNNNNSLNLWIDTFFAYKYEYIDELNNNEYVRFITNDIDTSVIDSNCYNLIKSIQVENFKYNFDYIDNFIYWTKTQFRKKIHEILKVFSHNEHIYEILSNSLEGQLSDKNFNLIENRLINKSSDFESWFSYSSILKDILTFLLITISHENYASEKYELFVLEHLKEYIEILKKEDILKQFIIFSILNYDADTNSFILLDYKPPKNIRLTKIVNDANKIMTLNYDDFLEKVTDKSDIYHLHGRMDCIHDISKNKLIKIDQNNLKEYFFDLLNSVLIGLSPRSKKMDYFFYDRSAYFFYESNEKEIHNFFDYLENKDETQNFLHLQEILKSPDARQQDGINMEYALFEDKKLDLELMKLNIYQNEKIVLLGVNPLGDLSYIVELIINYDEIYIGYFSEDDKNNLFETINNLFEYICDPINSFYNSNVSIVINRLQYVKFYYFHTNDLL